MGSHLYSKTFVLAVVALGMALSLVEPAFAQDLRCSGSSHWCWTARFGDSGRRILAHSKAPPAPLVRLTGASSPQFGRID